MAGFGTAGAELIAKNMRGGAENALGNGECQCGPILRSKQYETRGLMDLFLLLFAISGRKVTCVFGFCKIDDFTSICSGLEEDVCTYINTIAHIVHHGVVLWNGSPNKNTGSAFFCVWKLEDERKSSAKSEMDINQVRLPLLGPLYVAWSDMMLILSWLLCFHCPQVVKLLREKNASKEGNSPVSGGGGGGGGSGSGKEDGKKRAAGNFKKQLLSVANRVQQLGPTVDSAVLAFISIRCELEYADRHKAFQRFRDRFGNDLKVSTHPGLRSSIVTWTTTC